MPEFTYVARDPKGERRTGTLEAATRREASAALAARDLFAVEVKGRSSADGTVRVGRISRHLMATTLGQLADLLRSGVPMLRALEVLRRQTSHAALREVLSQIHRQVEDGATLAEAMGRYRKVFGEISVSMVRAGGEGGFMEEALSRIAEFTEAQEDLKSRTMGAMAYPCFLAAIGFAVVVVLLIFFVPRFESLFENMRQRNELPLMTEWVLGASSLAWRWALWIVVGAGLGAWFTYQWQITESGRVWRDTMKLRLPLVGRIFCNLSVARFCRVLGTLLHNGVPILRSLEVSSDATGNRVLSGAIQQATENISAGEALATPLAACEHFPPAVTEMIAVAEESNTLETVLLDIADSLERRTWRQLDLAVRFLEPIMLLLLASVVLVLVIALLLPVLKMSTTI